MVNLSVRLSTLAVAVRRLARHPPPLSSPRLTLAAHWSPSCSVAGVSDSVSSSLASWGRGDEGTPGWWSFAKRSRWAEIERRQQRLIINLSCPKQTYCEPKITSHSHCRSRLFLRSWIHFALPRLPDDAVIVTVGPHYFSLANLQVIFFRPVDDSHFLFFYFHPTSSQFK